MGRLVPGCSRSFGPDGKRSLKRGSTSPRRRPLDSVEHAPSGSPPAGAPSATEAPPYSHPPESLTLIIPSRNEAPSLARVVRQWWEQRPAGFDLEILVVDDASTDDTPRILRELGAELPVHTLRNTTRLGYGGSLREGILHTRTKWVAFTDADGQFDPGDLPNLLAVVSSETVLANGWRPRRADPFIRIVISIGFRSLLMTFFGVRIRDPTSTLKAARTEPVRAIAQQFRYMNGSFGNEFTIRWVKSGYTIVPVAIRHHPRLDGDSRIVSKGAIGRVAAQQFIALLRLWREMHRLSLPASPAVHPEPGE